MRADPNAGGGRGKLDALDADNLVDEEEFEADLMRYVPCLEPMSTMAHSSRSLSQNTVACNLETSMSFNRRRSVNSEVDASLPI